MAVISELIRSEADGTVSFGDYTLAQKSKLSGFEFEGDSYKVKTFKDITKLEKNESFVYESVPGTAVQHMKVTDHSIEFQVEGEEQAQLTLELEAENEDLARILDSGDTDRYMEKLAREGYGYAYPDEFRFYDTSRN